MAGKRSGGGLPQGTIRRVARRGTIWGALDARRTAEQDVREVKFVRPRGSTGAIIQNPGGSQESYAANLLGRTLRPGTTALALSKSGEGGDNIIPGSSVGRKGAIPASPSSRPYATPAPVVAGANQYAFGNDGVDLYALLYSDGTYVSTRSTLTLPTETVCGIILTDAGLLVGDGSALLSDAGVGGTSIKVWDVEGATTYSYSIAAGWLLAAYPVYSNGAIYWLEVEDGTAITGHLDTTMQIRLCTALTDLTSDSVIRTETLNAGDFGGTLHWHSTSFTQATFMADDNGAVAYVHCVPHEAGHGTPFNSYYQWRWALSGGAGTYRDFSADTYVPPDGTPLLCATLAAGAFLIGADTETWAKTDDASAQATLLDSGLTGTAYSINVGPNGTTRQVYNFGGGIYRNGVLVVGPSGIDAFDTINGPDQFFYFGA